MEVTLEPGDVLYVPPYYFHHVESLTASVSLSTWSTERTVKTAMDAAYGRGIFAQVFGFKGSTNLQIGVASS